MSEKTWLLGVLIAVFSAMASAEGAKPKREDYKAYFRFDESRGSIEGDHHRFRRD